MAKFFVGQRVRAVRCNDPRNEGAEGNVTHIGCWNALDKLPNGHLASNGMDIVVMFDRDMYCGFWTLRHAGGSQSCLEPILPSGHRASEYSLTELLDRCRAGEGVAA